MQLLSRTILRACTVLALAVALLTAAGCTTMTPVGSDVETIRSEIQPGDVVEVVTRDGVHSTFRVVKVNEQSITGHDQHGEELYKISMDDVLWVDKDTTSTGARIAGEGPILAIFIVLMLLLI